MPLARRRLLPAAQPPAPRRGRARTPALLASLALLSPAGTLPWAAGARAVAREEEHPTSMERLEPADPRLPGVVVAAPHEGFDLHTEEIARAAGEELGCTVVVARNFRKHSARRYVNVNRPSESEVTADGDVGPERETERAREVFDRWCRTVGAAEERVPLYVEVHGFARSVRRGGDSVPLEVVELATVGVDRATARRLRDAWTERADELGLPPLYVDELDARYEFLGQREPFHHRATEARTSGILRRRYVERALHFELPAPVRQDASRRRAVARAIAAVVAAAAPVPAGD